jgi:hypothetical protein
VHVLRHVVAVHDKHAADLVRAPPRWLPPDRVVPRHDIRQVLCAKLVADARQIEVPPRDGAAAAAVELERGGLRGASGAARGVAAHERQVHDHVRVEDDEPLLFGRSPGEPVDYSEGLVVGPIAVAGDRVHRPGGRDVRGAEVQPPLQMAWLRSWWRWHGMRALSNELCAWHVLCNACELACSRCQPYSAL